jgi:hypothetical protein
MVSKNWRSLFDHITAAIRGWKNRHRADIPGDHRKRSASHRYIDYARRRATNDVIASITIADIHSMRMRFNRGTNRFIREHFFGMRDEQIERALHCINAHRSEIFKIYRHIVNEI